MKPQEQDAPLSGWASRAVSSRTKLSTGVIGFVYKTLVIAELEVRKLRHDPTELFIRAVQPALWLLIFGQVFTRVHGIPTGDLRYIDFLAPGILAQSVLFVAIFSGMSVIWERDLGIVHKLLVAPAPRTTLVLGKALAAGVRSLSQVAIVYLLALLLGVKMSPNLLSIVAVVGIVFLGAGCFSTFSLVVACIVKTRERFMGIGQVLTMPLFFASNAIYPLAIMPHWLQVISHVNPLTYEVDALRGLLLADGRSMYSLGLDFGVLLIAMAILVTICGRIYPNVAT